MPPKLSTEYVREFICNNGCSLESEYINMDQKLSIRCRCGNLWEATFHSFKANNTFCCTECGDRIIGEKHKYDIPDLVKRITDTGFSFSVSDYADSRIKINFQDAEGYKYFISIQDILSSHKRGRKVRRFTRANPYTLENICLWAIKNNKPIAVTSVSYPDAGSILVSFSCHKCSLGYDMMWDSIKRGRGCPYCAKRKVSPTNNLEAIFPYLAKEWDYEKNDKLPKDYQPQSNKKVFWICNQCGNKWKSQINDRSASHTGCPVCNMSGGAKQIYYWLSQNNYDFRLEQTFDDLLSNLGYFLRYDFSIISKVNKKIIHLIEFDHKQHFENIEYFYKTEEEFELRKEYDRIKDEYAIKNKIPLIRIRYDQQDDIENILSAIDITG